MRRVVQCDLREHRQRLPVRGAHYRRAREARLHGARAPAETDPLVRRLSVPGLRDRQQVRVAVVVKGDDPV